ncbi:branched-chain amino acid ABC transporter permease [Sabulicella glaciei]|uniref:Branched-chain amino acid ABC transporter permease n=1 Tax=Sabulicella glaciei TaxID=2984948 RepID=A0ABT3NZQ4_9PROT|nr:branched-chain amino acid ABC transporter permease [Roseococcus sp. MDT2-1-1]MCW8087398.1 branched-chain amino acid ABC transporter permease [Roseococcus sp. MDT2-1-1]
MQDVIILALNGLAWGLIIALIALGLSVIFGLLDVINVAHGDFFMVGTVLAWVAVDVTGSFAIALVLVPLFGLLLGAVTERVAIRPVLSTIVLTVVSTHGLGLMLQEGVRATFGATPRRLLAPVGGTVTLPGDLLYDTYRLVAAAAAALALLAFFAFQQRTRFGTWMRAVRHDRETAMTLGIPVERVQLLTFSIGAGLALLGGVIAAPITTVDFRAGIEILPTCFMAVIIGGLGNLPGTAAAAILLAVTEGVVSAVLDPSAARIVSLCLMCAVLFLRPHGLFAGARA